MEHGTYWNILTALFSMLIKVSQESEKKSCKPSHNLIFISTYFHFSDLHLSDCWLGRLHRMAIEITWLISHIGIRVWICERACLKVHEEKRCGVQVLQNLRIRASSPCCRWECAKTHGVVRMIPLLTAKVKSSKISIAHTPNRMPRLDTYIIVILWSYRYCWTLVTSPIGYVIGETEDKTQTHITLNPPWLHVLFELNIYFLNLNSLDPLKFGRWSGAYGIILRRSPFLNRLFWLCRSRYFIVLLSLKDISLLKACNFFLVVVDFSPYTDLHQLTFT